MPTGYTHIIDDDENVTLKDFISRCARAFGACIMLRDEPLSNELPDAFEPSPFYREQYEKSLNELEKFNSLDFQSVFDLYRETQNADFHRKLKSYNESVKVLARYDEMAELVRAWTPPSPDYNELKSFMLEQLQTGRPYVLYADEVKAGPPNGPTIAQVERWRITHRHELEKAAEKNKLEYEKECERTAGRNEWIRVLKDSIGGNDGRA